MYSTKKKSLAFFMIICLLLLNIRFNFGTHNDNPFDIYFQPDAEMFQKWFFNTGDIIETTAAAADLTGDGFLEIVFGSDDNRIYCVNHLGEQLWNFTTGDDVRSSAAIGDINSDGFQEIIVGSNDNYVYCLNSSGDLEWSFNTGNEISSSPTLADLNNDGSLEIIVGNSDLFCLFNNGSIYWSSIIGIRDYTEATTADLNDDGFLEVILTDGEELYVYFKDGSFIISDPCYFYTSPAIADIDQDGDKEIIIVGLSGSGYGVYCFDFYDDWFFENWYYPLNEGYDYPTAVTGDLDQDGTYEIIVCPKDENSPICLNHLGVVEWVADIGTEWDKHLSPAIADINADNYLEVIVYQDNDIYCFDYHGFCLCFWYCDPSYYSSPIVVDIDLDGKSEIIKGGLYDQLECFGFSDLTSSGDSQWASHRGSSFRTGQTDSDSDYLDDLTEEFYGTDKNNNDTDFDLLLDMSELFTYHTDPFNNDSDTDQLLDGLEVHNYFTDPLNNDTDADKLLDGDEVLIYKSNPFNNDTDSDNLYDWDEIFIYGTNITNSDTDLDGLKDGEEILTYSTNPFLYDTDFDGYSDYIEIIEGTDPLDSEDHPPTTITEPPITITPPPETITPPPETVTIPETITQNKTITTTVETGIIFATSIFSVVVILTITAILSRKRRK